MNYKYFYTIVGSCTRIPIATHKFTRQNSTPWKTSRRHSRWKLSQKLKWEIINFLAKMVSHRYISNRAKNLRIVYVWIGRWCRIFFK